MYRVDITADLNDEDHTGYLWTFLDEARDPAQITPGALVVAGDEDAAAVCQVIDLVPAGDGTIVHLRPPGLVDDYRALVFAMPGRWPCSTIFGETRIRPGGRPGPLTLLPVKELHRVSAARD